MTHTKHATHSHPHTAHKKKSSDVKIKDMPRATEADNAAYTLLFNRSKAVGLDANSTEQEVIEAEEAQK